MAASQSESPETRSGDSRKSPGTLADGGVVVPARTFWERLGPAVRTALSDAARSRAFAQGSVLSHPGEVLIIRTGWAKVTPVTADGTGEVTLRLYGPGDQVGDDVALTGRPQRTTITAITDVHALALPAATFTSMATADPRLTRILHQVQEERLNDAEQRIITATADGAARIARLLLDLCDRYGTIGQHGITIPIPLSQADFGALTDTSRKTVVRTLSRLRNDGLIATGYRTITITNPSQLRERVIATLGPTSHSTYRLLLAIDIEKYSTQHAREQLRAQTDLRNILTIAAENVGLDRNQWYEQVSGDNELAVLPQDTDVPLVVGDFTRQLQLTLAEHNQRHTRPTRLRIRIAMHYGPITPGPYGPAGDTPIAVTRLLHAQPLRRLLTEQPNLNLALILSAPLYRDVVRTRFCALDPTDFRAVRITAKGVLYQGFILHQTTP